LFLIALRILMTLEVIYIYIYIYVCVCIKCVVHKLIEDHCVLYILYVLYNTMILNQLMDHTF